MKSEKIIRDDGLEMGFITQIDRVMPKSQFGAYQGSGSWMATPTNGGSKYFVYYYNALKWLERQNKNIYPISRLVEFVNR